MADTIRNRAALQGLLADNATGDISPQDIRDFLVSCYNWINDSIGGDIYYSEDKVGIGTGSPGALLNVHSGSSAAAGGQVIISGGNNDANQEWSLKFQLGEADTTYNGELRITNNSAGHGTDMVLLTSNTSGVSTERMRLDEDGNVGIGVTATNKLDVNGDSIRIRTAQSPAAGGAGNAGEIAWDASYLYICTSTNTWKRVGLTGGY